MPVMMAHEMGNTHESLKTNLGNCYIYRGSLGKAHVDGSLMVTG
jgi:hypothetical protein